MITQLVRSQPLLLPALAGLLSILAVDSLGLYRLLLVLLVLSCCVVAKRVSRLVFVISAFVMAVCGVKHSLSLSAMHHLKAQAGIKTSILAVVESESREVGYESLEARVRVLETTGVGDSLLNERLLVNWSSGEDLKVGQQVWFLGRLAEPRKPMNPAVYDKAGWMYRQGMVLEMHAERLSNTGTVHFSYRIHAWAQEMKTWIKSQLTRGVKSEDAKNIIIAMFLGEKPRNGRELIDDFRNSGTIHVFAVSGLHVMMIGLIFSICLRLLGCSIYLWVPVVTGVMFFYAIVTGMNPPAMRAAIMGAVVLMAMMMMRKPSLPNSLWLSAVLAMAWNTHCVFLPSFQLSFAVLISICLTTSWWKERWRFVSYVDPFFPKSLFTVKGRLLQSLKEKLVAMLTVASSAWTGSCFLIWFYFGLITPLSIIASVPIVMMVFALLLLSCLSLLVGSVSERASVPINKFNSIVARTTHLVTQSFSSVEWLRYQDRPWSRGERIVIYSIPEGGATNYIGINGGVLIDAADRDSFYSEVMPSLRKNGAPVDSLIVSHADSKHIEGFTVCLEKFPIKQMLIGSRNKRSQAHQKIHNLAEQLGVRKIMPVAQQIPLGNESSIYVMPTGVSDRSLADDRSLIIWLDWRGKQIVFVNDGGSIAEQVLMDWVEKRQSKADVIVLGKHIRDYSISSDTIEFMGAKTVIASHSEFIEDQGREQMWIKNLKEKNIKLHLLNETGAITMSLDTGEDDIEYSFRH